jgi:diaminopimelate decarboxylase
MQLDELILDFVDEAQAHYERPVVVYDLRRIKERVSTLIEASRTASSRTSGAEKENVKFLFAQKSFPFSDVTKVVAEAGVDGFDVSNAREWSMVAEHTRPGAIVSVSGPAWHGSDFDPAASTSNVETVIWNASTPVQLQIAMQRCQRSPAAGRIGIRLRSEEASASSSSTATAEGDRRQSRFGFGSLHDAIETANTLGLSRDAIAAVHVHRGWDSNDLDSCRATVERVAKEIAKTEVPVRFVNLGGGLHRLGLEGLDALIAHARAILPKDVTLLFEPGRICSDACGFAICKIIDSFRTGESETTVVLDASHGCHFRWSEPSYLLPRAKATAPRSGRAGGGGGGESKIDSVLLCGSTCDETDRIGRFVMRTEEGLFEPGRFVLLGNVAGYSAAWNKGFNGLGESDVRFIG